TPALFRASIPLPAEVPVGNYEVDVRLFADGNLIARTPSAFEVYKAGFEQVVTATARDHGLFYGLCTAGMALLTGWFASVVFRRD
ncbi:MAG TPA: TIGR02186 family protein, partial [Gammaproteobacteria bacterium]|nr:TIGR02186 family protein [Gammaproteobacteria bacterium]